MYTVALVHDLGKVCHVHHMSLKPCIQGNPALTESLGGQAELSAPLVIVGVSGGDASLQPESGSVISQKRRYC